MLYNCLYNTYIILYYAIILETLGPGGARVAVVNTIEETATAILSRDIGIINVTINSCTIRDVPPLVR